MRYFIYLSYSSYIPLNYKHSHFIKLRQLFGLFIPKTTMNQALNLINSLINKTQTLE